MHEPLLSAKELAALLGCSVSMLKDHRHTNSGPPYVKVGRLVRYRAAEAGQWLERHRLDGKECAR